MTAKQKFFEVIEVYPQATVTATIIVKAPDSERAKHHPHEAKQIYYAEDVDQGGEAYTEDVREITDPAEIQKWVEVEATNKRKAAVLKKKSTKK